MAELGLGESDWLKVANVVDSDTDSVGTTYVFE